MQLFIADADAIQEYVFSSSELKLIRGGSHLQSSLMDELKDRVSAFSPGIQIRRANGGTLLAELPDGVDADALSQRVEAVFRRRTASGTVSCAAVPGGADFPSTLQAVQEALARKKRRRTLPDGIAALPHVSACEKCGRYPASELVQEEDDRARGLCAACVLQREANREARRKLNRAEEVRDFEDLGRASTPQNYIAIVYVDVDRLGRYMYENGTTGSRYAELSGVVDAQVKRAVQAGTDASNKKGKGKSEVLLAGGDDAIVAISADSVFAFLQTFQREFDNERNWMGYPRPPFSTGIAIAHSHFPIADFRRMSSELCRSAKRVEDGHSLDYEIVTTSLVRRISETREPRAWRDGRLRTAKPYRLTDWFHLCDHILTLKRLGAPTSQVKALYRIAHQGPAQADSEYRYLLTRLPQSPERDVRGALVAAIGGSSLWWRRSADGVEYTNATDLVELWDFVHEPKADD